MRPAAIQLQQPVLPDEIHPQHHIRQRQLMHHDQLEPLITEKSHRDVHQTEAPTRLLPAGTAAANPRRGCVLHRLQRQPVRVLPRNQRPSAAGVERDFADIDAVDQHRRHHRALPVEADQRLQLGVAAADFKDGHALKVGQNVLADHEPLADEKLDTDYPVVGERHVDEAFADDRPE